jgi:hypothetical protein
MSHFIAEDHILSSSCEVAVSDRLYVKNHTMVFALNRRIFLPPHRADRSASFQASAGSRPRSRQACCSSCEEGKRGSLDEALGELDVRGTRTTCDSEAEEELELLPPTTATKQNTLSQSKMSITHC